MRIIHFSDFHISENKFIPVEEFLNVLEMVYQSAIDYECPYIIFSGDFFDKKKNPRWLYDRTIETILKLDKKQWILGLGNHDRDSEGHSLELFKILEKKVKHVKVVDVPCVINLGNYRVQLIHGVGPGSVLDNGFTSESKGLVDVTDDNIEECDYVCAGHLHRHQRFNSAKQKFGYYAGCPLQLCFGDDGNKKGWLLINLETKKKKFIENTASKKFKVYYLDLGEIGHTIRDDSPNKEWDVNQDYVKFVVHGSASQILKWKTTNSKLVASIVGASKHINETVLIKQTLEKRIQEITQTSSLEDDACSFVDTMSFDSKFDKEQVKNGLIEYIKKARGEYA